MSDTEDEQAEDTFNEITKVFEEFEARLLELEVRVKALENKGNKLILTPKFLGLSNG